MQNGLAAKIKAYRIIHSLSVRQFAETAEISHTTIYAIEAGKADISVKTLRKIALVLGIRLEDCLK
jgi:DNA-binding XRE family transcriptional regulator